MAKAGIYHHDGIIDNFELTTADITLSTGQTASAFNVVKDSNDNVYLQLTLTQSVSSSKSSILKINNQGVIVGKSTLNLPDSGYCPSLMVLSRDENEILFISLNYPNYHIYKVAVTIIESSSPIGQSNKWIDVGNGARFAIYQDRYIWVASGNTVSVYDYTTRAELANTIVENGTFIAVDTNNICYTHSKSGNYFRVRKLSFDGVSTITNTVLYEPNSYNNTTYQMIVDKWGDLIFLNDTGGVTSLIKFNTVSNTIISTVDTGIKAYNLDTKRTGEYYYSDDLHTYEIPKNTAQGQVFNTPVEINSTGMTTFNNNMTGYRPSVQV